MVAEELKLVIQAEIDRAVRDLKVFMSAVRDTEKSISSVDQIYNKHFGPNTQKTTKEMQSGFQKFFSDAARGWVNWIRNIGIATIGVVGLKKSLDFILDSAKLNANFRQVEDSFQNIAESAGESANDLLAAMRRASKGTMDTVSMMKNAARANLFGLPLEKMAQLMEIAIASAKATGQSVEYMFDSLVLGIGRVSPKIIDNLGIMMDIGIVYRDFAATLGKTAEKLTEAEQKQAILNAVLERGGEIIKKVNSSAMTDAERWQALTAAITDLKTVMGHDFMTVARPFLDWLTNVARTAAEAKTNFIKMKEAQRAMMEGMDVKDVAAAIEGMKAEREKLLQALAMASMSGMDDPRAVLAEKKRIQDRIEGLDRQMYQLALLANAQQQHREEVKATVAAETKAAESANAAADAYKAWFAASHAEAFRVRDIFEEADAEYITAQLEKIEEAQREAFRVRDIYDAADALETYADALRAAATVDPAPVTQITSDFEELAQGIRRVTQTYEELKEKRAEDAEEAIAALEKQKELYMQIYDYMQPVFQSFGESAEAMKDAIKDAIAAILQMLGKEAFIRALLAFATGNVGGGAAFMAASVAANAASGAVRAMKEGGIVTKPTAAVIGEAGPEAVIPLDRMPMGNITINVQGNVIRERDMYRAADRWRQKAYAGY